MEEHWPVKAVISLSWMDPLSSTQALSETLRKRATNWFDQTLVSRLNNRKKGVIVLVIHRFHLEDLTGHLLSKPKNIWHHICLPMVSENKEVIYSIKKPELTFLVLVIQVTKDGHTSNKPVSATYMTPPARIYSREEGQLLYHFYGEKEEVEMIKAELGSYAFAAQYQQTLYCFQLKRYRNFPDNLSHVTQSWNTSVSMSNSSNFSVCTTWTKVGNKFYLLDVYHARLEYPKLKEQVLSLHVILIEAKTSGKQLVQELKANDDLPIIEIVPHDDKLARFHQIVLTIESGKVFLPHQVVG
nr:hypothetical protein [Wolbachia endosymbiont of Mansonella ozzardi]